ncbi:DNA replication/recombination/repair protein [Escherichia coli]|nr:DNA replication/recombination/repair protein [Escherichia coli]
MMRQSLQAVLPEISGNKTSLLRKSVCSDLLTLFNSPHSALPSLLVSGMPEWQVHNPRMAMENEHQYSGARCSGQAAYVAKRQECAK